MKLFLELNLGLVFGSNTEIKQYKQINRFDSVKIIRKFISNDPLFPTLRVLFSRSTHQSLRFGVMSAVFWFFEVHCVKTTKFVSL